MQHARKRPQQPANRMQHAIADLHARAHEEADARGTSTLELQGKLSPRLLKHAPDRDEVLVLVLSSDSYVVQKLRSSDEGGAFTESELAALEEGGADLLHAPPDPSMAARAIHEYATLRSTAYSVEEAAALLRVNPSRIRQRLTSRPPTLYGLKEAGAWRIPRFQFQQRRLVPGIDRVIASLPPDLSPVAVARWFSVPSPDLELDDHPLSPIQWLQAGGDPRAAADLAASL